MGNSSKYSRIKKVFKVTTQRRDYLHLIGNNTEDTELQKLLFFLYLGLILVWMYKHQGLVYCYYKLE